MTDALVANDLVLCEDAPAWRRLCRMALIVDAHAHAINARREWGDYRDGWPQSAGVPLSELPGGSDREGISSVPTVAVSIAQAVVADTPPPSMPISESFAAFVQTQPNWSKGYHKQACKALLQSTSLMGDLPVDRMTGGIAETFRDRLKTLPAKHGTGI